MNKLLTLQYYFNTRPDPNFQFTKLTVILIILFFALSIGIKIYRKKYAKDPIVKKMIKRYPGRLLIFGTALLFLLVVREAGLPFLSMRIWWIALLVFVIYWMIRSMVNFRKEYKRRLGQAQKHSDKAKWLPKKKK